MRRILTLTREDLTRGAKLKNVGDIMTADLANTEAIANFDIVIFYCSLLHEYKILKNRSGTREGGKLDSPENENKLLSLLMEY